MWRTTSWCKIMAILIKICVFLMLFGIYDTTEWKPEVYAKGENVTVHQMDGKQDLKITFFGYTSKLHVTNVILYDSRKNLTERISVNSNYTGRVRMMNNDTLSFLLLNVNFMDSGNYTVSTLDGSVEIGNKSILVPRTVIRVQDGASSLPVQFMCNKTNIYSIKIEMIKHTPFPIAIYDVKQANCSVYPFTSLIDSCVLNENGFFLKFQKVSWLDKGTFVAWEDKGFLLDSIYFDIQEDTTSSKLEITKGHVTVPFTANVKQDEDTATSILENTKGYVTVPSTANAKQDDTTTSNLETAKGYITLLSTANAKENDKSTLLLVSAVVVVIVAACLAMIALRKIRHGTVPNTERKHITYRNREEPTANSSQNLYQNVQEAIPPEETRMVSEENNDADYLIDKSSNKGQVKVRLNEENIYHRRFDYAGSSPRITRNFQINSIAHVYDYIHENHDHCLSYKSNLRSSPNSTESIAEPCFKYDYVVQHSFMTLRPPAPDPVVTRKTRDRGTRADSISWYQRLNIKSASRVDPLTLYKIRSRESNCTVSSAEPGSRDFINQLGPSSYFELEGIRATDTMNSPGWLTYGGGPDWRKVESVNSSNFVPRSEFSELRAKSKSGRVAQFWNYDYPRSYFDHPSAMDRRHRRSQSLGDMMAIANVRWSKRKSARSCMRTDCYDSL